MSNVIFEIQNPLNERIKILNLIHDMLEHGDYDPGIFTQPIDNFEEYIKIKSVAFLTEIDISFNLFGNRNKKKVKPTYNNIDPQPNIQYWYKIPFDLYKDILKHDFKTLNLKTNRTIYYEVFKNNNKKYLKHRLVNKTLNFGPSFIPEFDKEKPQPVRKIRSTADAFLVTGAQPLLRSKEPRGFEFR